MNRVEMTTEELRRVGVAIKMLRTSKDLTLEEAAAALNNGDLRCLEYALYCPKEVGPAFAFQNLMRLAYSEDDWRKIHSLLSEVPPLRDEWEYLKTRTRKEGVNFVLPQDLPRIKIGMKVEEGLDKVSF